jgi:hypothetical protein
MEKTDVMRDLRLPMLLFASFIALPAPAQSPHTEYRVAGTVVSSIDNHPLQHATVDLLEPGDETRPVLQTTTSDEYGHFAFIGVPAGNHVLRGELHNYLRTEYEEHEGFTTGIVTGAGVDTESLILKLNPESVIAGSVHDETSDPVERALLYLLTDSNAGDGRLSLARNASTDDRGRFEFAHLQPGRYFLVITARPWYATYPAPAQADADNTDRQIAMVQRAQPGGPRQMQRPMPFGIADSIDPTLDVAYPTHFYPGTTDPNAAAPIQLKGGESLDLSFTLAPVAALTFTLPASSGKGVQQLTGLTIPFHGENLPAEVNQRQIGAQVVITGLAPGDYNLTRIGGPSPQSSFGTLVHISRDTSIADLSPEPGAAHIRAVLHSADGSPLPQHLSVALARSGSADHATAVASPKGEIDFDVPPGDYSFDVILNDEPYFVRQIISGERPLPGNQLHVAADEAATYTVFVSRGTHVLTGFARKEGKPCGGAFILMFQAGEAANLGRVFRDQSDLDGSFRLSGLAPGTYTLIAIEGGWNLDWRRPEVLAHYLPAALTVRIPETAEKLQPLHEPLPVQLR